MSRRTLAFIMLGALGLAAVSGVLAVMLPSTLGVWRVPFTLVVGAVSAGVLSVAIPWFDKPQTRRAAWLATAVAVGVFCLASMAIWLSVIVRSADQVFGPIAIMVLLTGIPAALIQRTGARSGWEWPARIAVPMIVVGLFLMIAGHASREIGGTTYQFRDALSFSGLLTAGLSLVALMCMVGFRVNGASPATDPAPWRWIGIGSLGVGLAVCLYSIWTDNSEHPLPAVHAGTLALAAVVGAAVIMQRAVVPAGFMWLRWVAVVALALAAASLTFGVWIDPNVSWDRRGSLYWRAAIAQGTIGVCAMLAVAFLRRMIGPSPVELKHSSITRINVECPRCTTRLAVPVASALPGDAMDPAQAVKPGMGALCSKCKLHITVYVHTAQCGTCGYDLTNLGTDTCPECGTKVG